MLVALGSVAANIHIAVGSTQMHIVYLEQHSDASSSGTYERKRRS